MTEIERLFELNVQNMNETFKIFSSSEKRIIYENEGEEKHQNRINKL